MRVRWVVPEEPLECWWRGTSGYCFVGGGPENLGWYPKSPWSAGGAALQEALQLGGIPRTQANRALLPCRVHVSSSCAFWARVAELRTVRNKAVEKARQGSVSQRQT